MATLSTEELENLCLTALQKAGLSEENAKIVTEHYLENEMSGKSSHGMVRVVEAVEAIKKWGTPKKQPEIEFENGSMIRFNAHQNIGAVAGHAAMKAAIEKAPEFGIIMIGIHNYIASSGSMAFYLRRIADAGLMAFMGCNSVALVAPPGSRKRMIGTNPIGIAIPGEDTHFIADLSTAAYAYGKIMVHKDKNEPIPEGILIDKEGHPSTNPKDAYDGAILPLSGYKGFSLGLMIELMAGPLIGAKAIKNNLCDEDGLFIIAIDPKAMGNTAFYQQIEHALATIKQTPTAPGHDAVALPGERSRKALERIQKSGSIEIADKTLEKIKGLAT